MTSDTRFTTYSTFWPFYLSQHRDPLTRLLHIFGTSLAVSAALLALFMASFLWLIVALLFGYGLAWIAHLFIEKNRPATFSYPLWSLRGDFHMTWLALTGRLASELIKYDL